MKYFTMLRSLLIFIAFPAAMRPATGQVLVQVVIRNVQPGKGSVVVGLYSNESTFLKNPAAGQIRKADDTAMLFTFNIQPGSYAIAAYQDLNDNKELDKGLFHIPKEPFGFSDHYRPRMSAPHFADCVLQITTPITETIEIK